MIERLVLPNSGPWSLDEPNKATNNGGGCRGVGMQWQTQKRPLVFYSSRSFPSFGWPLLLLSCLPIVFERFAEDCLLFFDVQVSALGQVFGVCDSSVSFVCQC